MAGGMLTDLNAFKVGDMVEMLNFSGFDADKHKRLRVAGGIWEVIGLTYSDTSIHFIIIRDPFTQRVLGPYYAARFIRV